jgi:glycosyltransferase involved in cell wall biosynthesis
MNRKRNPVKAILRSLFLRLVFRRASVILGTGAPALHILEKMGSPRSKLVNFPYFIDLDKYRSSCARQPREKLEFISCGRLAKEKGYDLALDALKAAYSGRTKNFRYRIAGAGPELENLKRQAKNIGIADKVEFLGWLEPSELAQAYADGDVFLHPARNEPYGVAILEAMASGLVVVGSEATVAVLDRVRNGENGYLHQSDDSGGIARIIAEVLAQPEQANRVKLAARKTAEDWPISRGVALVKTILMRRNR